MKKKIILLAALVMVALTFCACKSPKSTVNELNKAMKAFDIGAMGEAFGSSEWDTASIIGDNRYGAVLEDRFKQNAAKMKAKVVSSKKHNDTATVEVEYTFVDCSEVMGSALVSYAIKSVSSSLLGGSKDTYTLLAECVNDAFDKADTKVATKTVVYTLTKNLDGDWIVDSIPNGFLDVVTGNMLSPFTKWLGGN